MADKPMILIVEDDPSIRRMLALILKKNDYTVMESENGEDALRAFYERKPHLIISDIAMPKMDGKELCRIIRRDYSEELIPFIFLTARAELSDKREGFELGADDYIVKPFDPDDLLMRVSAKLERSDLVKKLTSIDDLTGVYNRRAFDENNARVVRFPTPYEGAGALALVELDHVKPVND